MLKSQISCFFNIVIYGHIEVRSQNISSPFYLFSLDDLLTLKQKEERIYCILNLHNVFIFQTYILIISRRLKSILHEIPRNM